MRCKISKHNLYFLLWIICRPYKAGFTNVPTCGNLQSLIFFGKCSIPATFFTVIRNFVTSHVCAKFFTWPTLWYISYNSNLTQNLIIKTWKGNIDKGGKGHWTVYCTSSVNFIKKFNIFLFVALTTLGTLLNFGLLVTWQHHQV